MTTRSASPFRPFLRALLGICLAVACAAPTLAQDATVIGTIEATVDGEQRSWVQIEVMRDGEREPLSSWTNPFMTFHDVTMQGFVEPRFMLQDTLSISVSLTSALPPDCPCDFDENSASVLYLSAGRMSQDLHISDDGGNVRLAIDVFEPVEEGVFRVEGSFEATLPFRESVTAAPDFDRAIEIVGTFRVDRLAELPLE